MTGHPLPITNSKYTQCTRRHTAVALVCLLAARGKYRTQREHCTSTTKKVMNSVSCSTIARSCQLKLELPIAVMAPPDKPPAFHRYRVSDCLKRCHNCVTISPVVELSSSVAFSYVAIKLSLVDTACVRCDSKTNQLLQSFRPESLCLYVRFPHASCLAFRMTHFISKPTSRPRTAPLLRG